MKYNFIKCLKPRKITNIYTAEEILVECGKCESCLMKKSLARTTRCKLESSCHRFTYFCTLTYDNEHLPKFQLIKVEEEKDDKEKELYDCVSFDGEVLGRVNFKSHLDKITLSKKCKTSPNVYPWLRSEDCQLFIKRLRKYIKSKTNEEIRLFYCGELGPVHFRPHFHLLLWFDKDETSEIICEAVSSCWSFGRVDTQLSSSKSASYVASYLNSTMYLPSIFKFRRTAPFSYHSWYLGESVFQGINQEIQGQEFESVVKRRIFRDGINTDIVLWRSLKARIVPKCKGYNTKSEQERIFSYKLNANLRNWTEETKPLYQARFIRDYVELFDFYSEDERFNEVLQYFRRNYGSYVRMSDDSYRYIMPSITDYDKFERSVYVELLTSRRFLRDFCCGNDEDITKYVQLVDEFYKYLDYENLKSQLDMEKSISKTTDKKSCKFFFHNKLLVNELKEYDGFKRFESSKKTMYQEFVKHKELNDKNLIFNYI